MHDNETATPEKRTKTLDEVFDVIDVICKSDAESRRRIWDLEARIGKYDAIFERYFQEELARRTGSKLQQTCGEISALDQLRYEMEKHRVLQAEAGRVGRTVHGI